MFIGVCVCVNILKHAHKHASGHPSRDRTVMEPEITCEFFLLYFDMFKEGFM